jgi:plastocyanin
MCSGTKRRRYTVASVIAVAGFAALFAVLPQRGAGVQVRMAGFAFRPAQISVKADGAVTFTNDSKFTHTATCPDCGIDGPLDSGDIQAGTFKTLTFPKAGTFQLFCRYHGEQGMIAEVTIK